MPLTRYLPGSVKVTVFPLTLPPSASVTWPGNVTESLYSLSSPEEEEGRLPFLVSRTYSSSLCSMKPSTSEMSIDLPESVQVGKPSRSE